LNIKNRYTNESGGKNPTRARRGSKLQLDKENMKNNMIFGFSPDKVPKVPKFSEDNKLASMLSSMKQPSESSKPKITPRKRKLTDLIIIPSGSRWKGVFDICLVLFAVYSTFTSAYYAALGLPTRRSIIIIDICVEVFFLMDIIFSFL